MAKKKNKQVAQRAAAAGNSSSGQLSEDDGVNYTNRKNLMFCSPHRREVCHICCCDHRFVNDIIREGEDADIDAINTKHDRIQEAEHRAMVDQARAQGHQGPVMLGSELAQQLYDATAQPPPSGQRSTCVVCGKGGSMKKCAQCKSVTYCSRECQAQHWNEGGHKQECKRLAAERQQRQAPEAAPATAATAAATATVDEARNATDEGGDADPPAPKKGSAKKASGGSSSSTTARSNSPPSGSSSGPKPLTWAGLEAQYPMPAYGKVLELRVVTQPLPPFLRWSFEGKDRKGDIRRVAFYLDHGVAPPRGLAQGKVMRWRDPSFHYFMDGSSGARIEDDELGKITFSDS